MATQNTAMDNAALIKEVNEAHKHKKYSVGYHAQTVVAVIVTIIMLFPLYWMIATSFKSAEEVQLVIPTLFPHEFHPENYLNVLQKANFMKYYWNTIVMTAGILLLQVGTGVLAAYGFAVGRFKGRNALFYVVLAVGVVVLNAPRLPFVLESIFVGAFTPAAFTGGAIGSVFLSMQKGVSRGIFSNEAGLGTGSIAHACADTRKPVKQGMFGIFEVFADTLVICTLTALVILCSGVPVGYGAAAGAELTISGFTATYGGWSSVFTAVALCCFAFSTIIGWGLYGSRCIAFLFRTDKVVGPFLVLYSFVAILGATMDLGLLWSIADTFNGLMSIPNLIALLLLSGTVATLVKEYFAGEKAEK